MKHALTVAISAAALLAVAAATTMTSSGLAFAQSGAPATSGR